MRVPQDNYNFKSFVQFLLDHSQEVFHEDEQKKWLKIYCLLNSNKQSLYQLFVDCDVVEMGDIFEVTMKKIDDPDWDETFYFVTPMNGLTLVFTSAIQENYAKTLGDRLRKTRGVEVMWTRHDLFNEVLESILRQYGGYVRRFMARRNKYEDEGCRFRPDYERRFNYTGEDGTQVLRELKELYGVFPESVYLQISEILQIQITNDGFYTAKEISPLAFKVFFTYLDTLAERVITLSDMSKRFSYELRRTKHNEWEGTVVDIEPGLITFENREINPGLINGLIKEIQEEFSFTNIHMVEGSFSYSATVTDEIKNSIFDISISNNQIVLVPRFRNTFESFLRFYRRITETIDRTATLDSYISTMEVEGNAI